jgi:hypothetical protein
LIVVAVRCKRLVNRDASLITTALILLSFIAVRCQRLVVYVTMFCDGCILVIDRIGRRSVGQIDRIVVGSRRLAM